MQPKTQKDFSHDIYCYNITSGVATYVGDGVDNMYWGSISSFFIDDQIYYLGTDATEIFSLSFDISDDIINVNQIGHGVIDSNGISLPFIFISLILQPSL